MPSRPDPAGELTALPHPVAVLRACFYKEREGEMKGKRKEGVREESGGVSPQYFGLEPAGVRGSDVFIHALGPWAPPPQSNGAPR